MSLVQDFGHGLDSVWTKVPSYTATQFITRVVVQYVYSIYLSNYLPSYEGIFEDTFVLRILSYEDNLLSYEDKSTRTVRVHVQRSINYLRYSIFIALYTYCTCTVHVHTTTRLLYEGMIDYVVQYL